MTCQSTGRCPMGIIGLGTESSLDRIRRPKPPQKSTTFMIVPPDESKDLECGQWYHQAPTPLANIVELLRNLVLEVPRKNQHVIRLFRSEPLDRMDRDVRTRKILPVLERVAIDRERHEVGSDARMVEQSVALARGAVAGYPSPLPGTIHEELDEIVARPRDLTGESEVAGQGVQACRGLGGEYLENRAAGFSGRLGRLGPGPQ